LDGDFDGAPEIDEGCFLDAAEAIFDAFEAFGFEATDAQLMKGSYAASCVRKYRASETICNLMVFMEY
jgi:tRNA G26 N,N-dimethylase Trm1